MKYARRALWRVIAIITTFGALVLGHTAGNPYVWQTQQGLATPTAPGAKPGDPPCSAYCSCCGDDQLVTQPKPNVTPGGRPMTVGLCKNCGRRLFRPGGRLVAGAPLVHLPLLAPHRAMAGRAAFLRAPAALPPLTALAGIREGRVRQLKKQRPVSHLANWRGLADRLI